MTLDLDAVRKNIDRLRAAVSSVEQRKSFIEGQIESLQESLKSKFQVSSYEESIKKLRSIEDEITSLEQDLQTRLKDLTEYVDSIKA
jgi:prefoldin subunit 5